ncbi:vitamin B12-dependent ribonucleotide reductase [Solwaraspora sp. WMMD792]|nr:vitamin B12-dependent ribonucleotide reductase [Solwaraspora sp. WMMD792]MDG4769942.1 vitamin B12-dependent ribonucleotide reductase [Solwaraspora sp. WMMD792]
MWTTEGVHPYDEVTWQRRDVVMTNWRDGTVNFEQRGVEFPESWSVNAANIVTTKYFRGAVGTPQREWSLKQLIDRVVKTYRAAGEQHGYFATPGDAEIFEHELTWMLLHQVFSFNSPVWFNVGTASPQQVSACQPYHSLVSTPAGLVPIGKLVEENAVGAKVYDAHGLTRILAVQANGIKDVLRLHTKAGYTLDVTADHLVWKSTGEGTGRFVEAGTLVAGDTLEWHRRGSDGEAEFHPGDVHEAALAGWLQSDGFVGQYDQGTNRSLTIEAMTVNDDELSWVVAAIDQVFPGAHRHERRVVTQDVTLDCRRTRLYGKNLRPFIEKWGLLARGTEMEVPATLFTAPLPVVAAYLKSIFQAEGYISAREASTLVGVDMIGERLIRGLQRLLLRFGIFARVGFKADPRPNRHGTWSLRIQNHGDRDTFAAEIGFVDARKSGKLEESFAKVGRSAKATKRLVIDRVESLGAMEVYDIQTESGEYLSDNLRVHNCFILAVDDSMDSILDWYKEEGLIFKGGSGSGVNLSRIRSSKELLSSGGTASGPVSFMRGADASAGTIKSGGATRRAAKMVILDVDHPDIEEFVQTKAREEDKIRALRDAGFDMDLGGADIVSVQYQNANNSVRVSDEFMRAYEDGGNFDLRARLDGSVIDTVDAKKLFGTIAQAAWECADPGLQYDDTINDWHTCPESGRITASNPCFTGDTLVHTDKGLIRFDALVDRSRQGESFGVYTHDATNPDAPADQVVLTSPEAVMITGTNEITRLEFSNGMVLRCTPNHRIWTTNRGYVEAKDLTPDDQILPLNQPTPATAASWEFRMRADARVSPGDVVPTKWQRESRLPEKWTEDFAHLLGWLVGDGSVREGTPGVRGNGPGASWVYSQSDPEAIVQRHQTVLESIVGLRFDPVQMPNGTLQLRSNRTAVVDFLTGLGVSTARAVDKRLPSSVLEAPPEIQAAFLRGLFDADGCAAETANGTRYVGLGAVSIELLREAQRLLSGFGIGSRIYATRKAGDTTFRYTTNGGDEREYHGKQLYDLRISGENIGLFASRIGFDHQAKAQRVAGWLEQHRFYRTDQTARLVSREFDGFETTYNLSEPRNHSYIANGVVVRNCSEYLHLDNSSCNLASLNLMKFLRADGGFEVEKFVRSVEFVITAMDISICFADFPTQKIGETTRAYRQLGIGYANLGALLMASGLPYDSEAGRSYAAAITSVMTGTAYRRSAELAGVVGAYDGYARNAEGHKRVMRKHAAASDEIRPTGPTATALAREAARQWEMGNKIGEKNGWRNSQASVLAPTGTIGLMMDCDTTGVEPDLALVKFKKLVGGGSMQIVNQTVPRALRSLGYPEEQVEAIVEHIADHGHVVDAPSLRTEHYPVFDCAMGERSIAPMGHVRMMAAVQPFISGAISKTVNMPEAATVADVERIYFEGWKLGLKALAIYRDNCKVGQPLSAAKSDKAKETAAAEQAKVIEKVVEKVVEYRPVRKRLPKKRPSETVSFSVGGAEGYLTASSYPDDGLGEVFLKMSKQGSTLAGVMDAFSVAISIGLQYGVPLETFVAKFTNMRFEPAGMTDDPDVRMAASVMDYIFRRLALDFLPYDRRAELGIFTAAERTAQMRAEAEAENAASELSEMAVSAPVEPKHPEAKAPSSADSGSGTAIEPAAASTPAPASVHSSTELLEAVIGKAADAPLCFTCGTKMRPAGSCYVCEGCGSTSGCS